MATSVTAHPHRLDGNYFDHGHYQLESSKIPQDYLGEEPFGSLHGSIIHHNLHHIRSRRISPTTFEGPISNRNGRSKYERRQMHSYPEQRPHANHTDKPEKGKIIRQGSGFILQPPGLARVSSDSVCRPNRRIWTGESSLRANTLAFRLRNSPPYQQPLASTTSPTLSSISLQLSPTSYQGVPSPPLQSPLLQHPSSLSQLYSHDNSSTMTTEADNFSALDRKKLSVSSGSSVPSALSSYMPRTVTDPVVIDWTSPSTRRREYREIDRCNRGFRRVWKTVAPRSCWCKSWRRDFYVGPRGYQGKPHDEGYGDGGDDDAGSVRRYRLDLVDDDDDEKSDDGGGERGDDYSDNNEGVNDERKDIAGKKMKDKSKWEERTFLRSIKGRFCRMASKDDNSDDANSVEKGLTDRMMEEKGRLEGAEATMTEREKMRERKKKKRRRKKAPFSDGLICFQLHEIPH